MEKLFNVPILVLPISKRAKLWKVMPYGYSIDVVGYLIEVISGKSLDQFLKERLFDPLGMIDTGFFVPEEKVERLTI